MIKLKLEKIYQYLKMNCNTKKAKKAFERIREINIQLFEKDSRTYKCCFCDEVVCKGSIKYGLILNCQNCGCTVYIHLENPNGFKKLKLTEGTYCRKDKVDKDSKLSELIAHERYPEPYREDGVLDG